MDFNIVLLAFLQDLPSLSSKHLRKNHFYNHQLREESEECYLVIGHRVIREKKVRWTLKNYKETYASNNQECRQESNHFSKYNKSNKKL